MPLQAFYIVDEKFIMRSDMSKVDQNRRDEVTKLLHHDKY